MGRCRYCGAQTRFPWGSSLLVRLLDPIVDIRNHAYNRVQDFHHGNDIRPWIEPVRRRTQEN